VACFLAELLKVTEALLYPKINFGTEGVLPVSFVVAEFESMIFGSKVGLAFTTLKVITLFSV
jgi:hypothetical protein